MNVRDIKSTLINITKKQTKNGHFFQRQTEFLEEMKEFTNQFQQKSYKIISIK